VSNRKTQHTHTTPGRLFVISGPSGSGKTTLAELMLKEKIFKNILEKSISFTTRPKRTGERDKKDYFFITEEQFKKERKAKKILEWVRYLGYYYGTPRRFVDKLLERGTHIIMCVDLKGAGRLKRLYPAACVTIFIAPPSLRELRDRIEKRCRTIHAEEVSRRVTLAKEEMLAAGNFDYCLVNKNLSKTATRLKSLLLSLIRSGEKND
jgi:guanylate kinase